MAFVPFLSTFPGCSVSFLANAGDFQQLSTKKADGSCPGGKICELQGSFKGTVILGFGDYCVDDGARRRNLQGSFLKIVKVESGTFSVIGKEEDEGCDGLLDVICWIQTFLANLLSWVFGG